MTVLRRVASHGIFAQAPSRAVVGAACTFIYAALLLRVAWISDDAYITLRSVDNFVSGYGLTWNPVERVQAYTHPLWMLLLTAGYFLTHEAYYTTLLLCAGVSLAAVLLLAFKVAGSRAAAGFAIMALTLSKAFLDYSTSGLENPLTHLLLVVFGIAFLRADSRVTTKQLFILALLTSLIALNRSDAILLVLPALGIAWFACAPDWRGRILNGLGVIVLGFVPLLVWEAFTLLYYGFPFPNTFYAKLSTGIAAGVLLPHGVTYLISSSVVDPLTPLLIVSAVLLAFWRGTRAHKAIALGIGLYLLYVVRIGGDFMAGRFLSAPLLSAVLILCSPRIITNWTRAALPVFLVLVVGLVAPRSPLYDQRDLKCAIPYPRTTGTTDERGCYFDGTGLLNQRRDAKTHPNHPLTEYGLEFRSSIEPISILGAVGMYGFYAGPEKYVLDLNALGDPLMARIPVPEGKPWRIGHFERLVPAGYQESLVTGQNKLCDENLAAYYDRLALITRGPVFDASRLATIAKMNLGQYDYLVRAYDATRNAADQMCNAREKVNVEFVGAPRLRGYDVSTDHARRGDRIRVTLYWQDRPDRTDNLASFVHIRNSRPGQPENPDTHSDIWTQREHYGPGGRGTSEYWPPQVYADLVDLQLPESIPAGDYMIEIGWFDGKSGEQVEPAPDTVQAPLRINWRSINLASLRVD